MNARKKKLVLDVAGHFENACTPMHHDWLVENEVTADECCAVSDLVGQVLKGFVLAPQELKTLILVCSAAEDEEQAKFLINNLTSSAALRRAVQLLKNMSITPAQPANKV